MTGPYRHLQRLSLGAARAILLALLALVVTSAWPNASALAQNQQAERDGSHSTRPPEGSSPAELEVVERAMSAVCTERETDPLGSMPIDEMQERPSLPVNHPDAVAGARRATRLLPVAKELAVVAVRRLGNLYNIDPRRIAVVTRRMQAVTEIEPDMELRDNASITLSDPHTINFGTIFLAGLRSDEGMISVLAHELTHIGDGKDDSLRPLFRLVGRRAASLTGLRLWGRRPEELTADLVGAMAARSFIARTPNNEPLARRVARLVEHNCVDEDDTDEDHLSPRNTMRALLALDPTLAHDMISSHQGAPPAVTLQQMHTRRTSLTIARPASYHHRFR